MLSCVCQGLPHAIVDVAQDDRGMLSLMLYGVEQAYEPSVDGLKNEVKKRCEAFSPRYTERQLGTLTDAFRIIAQHAQVAPGRIECLQIVELLNGMLVIMCDHEALSGSDDPIHLYAQALVSLKNRGHH